MTADPIRRIADAVLYEGYILWPYRKSAMKNQHRWTFGGVYPQAYSEQGGDDDPCTMQAQCLLRGDRDTVVQARLRFLHVVGRQVLRAGPDALEPVEALEVDGRRHVSWEEATERELSVSLPPPSARRRAHTEPIRIPAGSRQEPHEDRSGHRAGVTVRSWRSLEGTLRIEAVALSPGLLRVGVRVHNTTPWAGGGRQETMGQTFCSAHIVLQARDGEFASLTDPPAELAEAATMCRNAGTWPVLVGEEGDRSTVLCSPIILPDYPQLAPESPGDLFDATEIDQMLVLNILTLTDEEKRDMRDADPRAREILERTQALTADELMRLHGTIREFGLARRS
jgi:hypothetical protein